ncbi:hypothetical protein LWI29_028749 [Acer saccharum]|uniref:THO1-MOS11 C-terminal domain-containing protein n=1 Tax=Acer saccharum TaxID=4024 RepID=A0AA39S767_ACESA|nr:hypothetical protein LWI29_028749 [Acer saccharum]KAK1563308.1 hypothetical protein Q3G72_025775 [Acer saccharum]
MATETEKPIDVNTVTAAAATDNSNNLSAEENPKKTMDSTDRVQNPTSVASSDAVSSEAVELKKEGDDLKTIEAPVSPSSASDVTVTDVQRKIRRAERFGVSVQLSEEEKRNSRAERFGTAPQTQGSEVSKKSEDLKRRARAERFGIPVPTTVGDEEAKKKARLARFAPYSKTDTVEEDKRKARALRFSGPPSSSPSQVNGEGNIEPKAAIAGKASGGA